MNCRQIENDLSAYVDGELTTARKAEIDAHLSGCPQCQARVAELRKLAEGVAALPKVQPAPEFLVDVKHKLRVGETGRVTWTDVLFRPYWLKVPVEALALIAVVATIHSLTRPSQLYQPRRVAALETQEHAKLQEAESYENAAAATPSTPPMPTPPGAPAESPPVPAASGAQRADDSVAAQRAAPELDRQVNELSKQAAAGASGGNRGAFGDGAAVNGPPPVFQRKAAAKRATETPKASSTVVVSASDFRQAKARAEHVAAELGGNVVSGKPMGRTSTNASDLVTGSSTVNTEGGITGQRFWVELPASMKEQFIAEFSQAVDELKLSLDLNTGREHALMASALTNELKDQDAVGVANGRVATLGVTTNTQSFDKLQFESGAGENLKLQEEPRLMLEIIVVPLTNSPAR